MPRQFELQSVVTEPVPPLVGTLRSQQLTLGDTLPHQLNGGVSAQAVQVDIQADLDNASTVYVGDQAAQLVALAKGAAWSAEGAKVDVSSIYVKAAIAGAIVNILWLEVAP